jgi:hypothetical protein
MEEAMFQQPALPVDHEQSRLVALRGRLLGDEFLRQGVFEWVGFHAREAQGSPRFRGLHSGLSSFPERTIAPSGVLEPGTRRGDARAGLT